MEFLTYENVTFYYEEGKEILKNINLSFRKKAFHCLVGKSGCGKTTLLKLAAGLIQPKSGIVSIDGQPVTAPGDNTSFVFQAPTLLNWKTVLENVLLPISLKSKVNDVHIDLAKDLLDMMGMKEYVNVRPSRLSGGQQARVSIARALVTRPSLLFMDEPFAALDALTKEELQDDLLRLCEEEEMTVLFITHDIQEAVYLADTITVMEKGQLTTSFTNERNKKEEWRYSSQFIERCRAIRQELGSAKK